MAVSNLSSFEIYLDPSLEATLDENSLRFMLAHEISHYLYEINIRNRGSTTGNKSYQTLLEQGFRCNMDQINAHVEVDLIAVVLLERMGYSNSSRTGADAIQRLGLSCDGEFRIFALQNF
jgi:hypothetical protein